MLAASDPRVTLRVGGVVLAALAAAVAFAVFVLGHIELGRAVRFEVYFAHLGALRAGAPLMVAGQAVGKVEEVALIPENRAPAGHPLHGTGGAVARVRLDAEAAWMVPRNGEIFVSSRGALSDRYLEVGPPPEGVEIGPAVRAGDKLRGVDPPSIDRALQQTWDNLVRTRVFLEAVRPEWDQLMAQIDALGATLDEIEPSPGAYRRVTDQVRTAIDGAADTWQRALDAGLTPDAVAALGVRFDETLAALHGADAQLRGRLASLRAGLDRLQGQLAQRGPRAIEQLRRAIDAADAALARLDGVVAQSRALLAGFARGEGSIARIMNDPEFPEDTKELGKVLKRRPWRLISHPQNDDRRDDPPARPPSR